MSKVLIVTMISLTMTNASQIETGVGRGLVIGGAGSSLASTPHSRAHAYARTHRPGAADHNVSEHGRGVGSKTLTGFRTAGEMPAKFLLAFPAVRKPRCNCTGSTTFTGFRTAGEMPAKFLLASPAVRKPRCNRGFPPVAPPFVLGCRRPPRNSPVH
jgi:hypothetical protein